MRLTLARYAPCAPITRGLLFIGGHWAAHTLEDPVPQRAAGGPTCIPAGTYRLRPRHAGRWPGVLRRRFGADFGWCAIEVADVPGRDAILIHTGNWVCDTRGCILVGSGAVRGMLTESRIAYRRIAGEVVPALQRGETVELHILSLAPGEGGAGDKVGES